MLKKVLYCQPTSNLTGSENSLFCMAELINEHNIASPMLLVGEEGAMTLSFRDIFSDYRYVRAPKLSRNLYKNFKFLYSFFPIFLDMVKVRRQHGRLIVHVNSLMFPQAYIAARFCGMRVVTHVREIPNRYKFGIYHLYAVLARLCSNDIVVVCRYIQSHSLFLSKSKVFYNFSDFFIDKRGAGLEGKRILMVIGLSRNKGADLIPEIVNRICERIPSAEFNIVGLIDDRSLYDEVLMALEKFGYRDRVVFHGAQLGIERFYACTDILIHPSRFEAFPRVVVESMACSVPVLAFDVGGTSEAIVDGETGYIFPLGSTIELCDSAVNLLEDAQLLKQFSEASFDRYQKYFGRDVVASSIKELYENI